MSWPILDAAVALATAGALSASVGLVAGRAPEIARKLHRHRRVLLIHSATTTNQAEALRAELELQGAKVLLVPDPDETERGVADTVVEPAPEDAPTLRGHGSRLLALRRRLRDLHASLVDLLARLNQWSPVLARANRVGLDTRLLREADLVVLLLPSATSSATAAILVATARGADVWRLVPGQEELPPEVQGVRVRRLGPDWDQKAVSAELM